MTNPQTGPPSRLISHFSSLARDQQSQGWLELWESEQSHLWDRGNPSPALIDFIESHPTIIRPQRDGRRLRALVPGCGKGYDVAMLALHGFDVYGLDVSEKGAGMAQDYTTAQLARPSELNFGTEADLTEIQPGRVKIITADFFSRDWEAVCVENGAAGFDLIYDYTFLCALLPEMRRDWACRMSELLNPNGILVCLEFPLYKDINEAGPPWGLGGVYWNILAQGGNGLRIEHGEEADISHGAFRRVLYFKPPRSYAAGRGTDMVSVWMLK